MQHHSISPQEMLGSFWRNRNLITALTKREVIGRYRGSLLGIFWSLFNPILMLTVYTFVFSTLLKARWNNGVETTAEFSLVLFAGLIVFNLFSECIIRAPSLILANVNYVKKVVFPLEILTWVSLGSALFHTAISITVWLAAYGLLVGTPHPSALLFPIIIAPLALLIMGLSWGLSSTGVYLRDISQVIGILTTALLFLSPVFYPIDSIPMEYRNIFYANPLTPAIEGVRDILLQGKWPDITLLATYYAVAAIVAWLGFAWFQKTRKGFSDVI